MPVSPVERRNQVSVWTSPDWIYRLAPATEGNTLIIVGAVFQTGLATGLGSTLIATIFCKMQDGKDVRMKVFARVLPVDIPLHSLSGTDSVGEHEQGQIDEKIFF